VGFTPSRNCKFNKAFETDDERGEDIEEPQTTDFQLVQGEGLSCGSVEGLYLKAKTDDQKCLW
jgi:hypothetical protein